MFSWSTVAIVSSVETSDIPNPSIHQAVEIQRKQQLVRVRDPLIPAVSGALDGVYQASLSCLGHIPECKREGKEDEGL